MRIIVALPCVAFPNKWLPNFHLCKSFWREERQGITRLFGNWLPVPPKCVTSFLTASYSVCRSVVYQQSSKESATLQPFFTLQLDIQSEKIRTVQEALETLVARESVQGYTTKTKQEVGVPVTHLMQSNLWTFWSLVFICSAFSLNQSMRIKCRLSYNSKSTTSNVHYTTHNSLESPRKWHVFQENSLFNIVETLTKLENYNYFL